MDLSTYKSRHRKSNKGAKQAAIVGGSLVAFAVLIGLAYVLATGNLSLPGFSPKFDASTDETRQASIKKMTEGMSDEEKEAFARDLLAVAMFSQDEEGETAMSKTFKTAIAKGFSGEKMTEEDTPDVFQVLHGKTVAEIRAEAETIRERVRGNREE